MKRKKIFFPPKGESAQHAYHSILEKKIKEINYPFKEFINHQILGSSLLILATIIAVTWASLPEFSASYLNFVKGTFGIHVFEIDYIKPITFWVNDIFLTVFFFFIGLEVKKEFIGGKQLIIKKFF